MLRQLVALRLLIGFTVIIQVIMLTNWFLFTSGENRKNPVSALHENISVTFIIQRDFINQSEDQY